MDIYIVIRDNHMAIFVPVVILIVLGVEIHWTMVKKIVPLIISLYVVRINVNDIYDVDDCHMIQQVNKDSTKKNDACNDEVKVAYRIIYSDNYNFN